MAGPRPALVLATHSLVQAEAVCDRLAVLARGRLLALGTVEELKARHSSGGGRLRLWPLGSADAGALAGYVRGRLPGGATLRELGGGALLCTLRGGLGGGGLAALFEALVEGAPACRWALCTSSLAEVVEAATQGALS